MEGPVMIQKAAAWWEPGEAGAARSKEVGRAKGGPQGSHSFCEGRVVALAPSRGEAEAAPEQPHAQQ